MQPFHAVVFDFDGTLATLTIDFALMRRKVEAVTAAFLDGNAPPDDGRPVLERVEQVQAALEQLEGRDLALEYATRCRFTILDTELKAADSGELFPGVREALAGLRSRGLATAIITRNSAAAVAKVFPDAAQSVGTVLAREDAPRVKPDPAHLLAALERLSVDPARALMVGDHTMDVVTGQNAGTHTAAVASGRLNTEELAAAGPDFLAPDVVTLLKRLDGEGLLGAS